MTGTSQSVTNQPKLVGCIEHYSFQPYGDSVKKNLLPRDKARTTFCQDTGLNVGEVVPMAVACGRETRGFGTTLWEAIALALKDQII